VTLDVNLSQSSALAAWGGDCTGAGTCTVVMDQPRHVIADLAIVRYRLFVSGSGSKGSGRIVSSPAGIDCSITTGSASGECAGYFDVGKPVTLTETPASGSAFGGWSGGGCGGTSSSCTVTMTDDLSVTALFNPGFRLTLALNGTGGGRVTSSPAGIDCERVDNITRGTCAADFSSGADIVLTATATYGSFGGWSGACAGTTPTCALRIVGTTSVGGTFTGTATLAITGTGGSGMVRSQPGLTPAIDCTLTNGVAAATGCSASYPVGTTIVLTATTVEGSGYSFGAWTGWCSGYEPTCTVSNIATSVTQRVGFNFNRCAIETSLPLGGQLSGSLTTSDCQVGEEIVRYRDSYSVTVPSQTEFLVTLNASWGGRLVSVPNPGAYWYSVGTTTSQTILVPAGRYVFHVMNQELNRVGNYTISSRTGGLGVCEHIRTTFGLTAASRTLDGNKCQYVASDRGTQAPAEPFSIYVPNGKTLRVTVVASDHEPLIEFRDGRGPDNVFDSALLATSSAGPRGFSASLSMVGGGHVKVWVTTRGTTSGSPYTITIDP
jgi:hypothetical protein